MGSQGVGGAQGTAGTPGAPGAQGMAGQQGMTGAQGATGAQGYAPAIRAGNVPLNGALAYPVNFSQPLAGAGFEVALVPNGLAGNYTYSNRTPGGFQMNVSGYQGAGNVGYIAVLDF